MHASNKGHGLRLQLYHTRISSFKIFQPVLALSTGILIVAIKDSSNLQSRHVVRVLKGIPPLSLVAFDAIQIVGWINLAAGHVYVESKLG